MVKKILTFLNKEFHGVNEAALLLGTFTLLSQILGLVRDRLFAHMVGPGVPLDVYYAAFRIPDFLYVSMASLASITVIMPFLVSRMEPARHASQGDAGGGSDGKYAAQKFLNTVFSAFLMCMVILSVIIYIAMPWLAHIIAPGFSPSSYQLLVHTSRIMLISPILIGCSNLIGTITQLFKKFFIFSLSPVFYNVGIIFGILFFYPRWGTLGLAYGVILGAVFHLVTQIPTVLQTGFLPRFTKHIVWKDVFTVIKVSLPRTLTLSFNSLAFIVLISLASKLPVGSISLFTFAFNLQSVPVGIIGISYSVALFPILVTAYAKNQGDIFRQSVISGIQQIIFWSIPVTTLLIILRAQIVRVLLGASTWSWAQTKLTAAAVALFTVCLVSQSIVLLLVRGYYAAGNTKKPLWVNLFSSIMVAVFGYTLLALAHNVSAFKIAFESVMRVSGIAGTDMLLLAFSYSLGSLLNMVLLLCIFRRDYLKGMLANLWRTLRDILLATTVMGSVSYFFLGVFDDIFSLHTFKGIFLQGFYSGMLGIIAGVIVLHLLKNKEYQAIYAALSQKFWKRHITMPEQADL